MCVSGFIPTGIASSESGVWGINIYAQNKQL